MANKKATAKPKAKKANSMPKASPMTAMDKRWQAESDARTLIEAEKIKADRTRLKNAKTHAANQARDAAKVVKL
jgi:hypothetical protein